MVGWTFSRKNYKQILMILQYYSVRRAEPIEVPRGRSREQMLVMYTYVLTKSYLYDKYESLDVFCYSMSP